MSCLHVEGRYPGAGRYFHPRILGIIFFLAILPSGNSLSAQEWPGMGPRVAKLAQHLVSTARVILEKKPGEPVRNIWVKNTRRYVKENGWFGLMVNGQPLEEKYVYLEYAGRFENLQALFTLGSGLLDELETFRLDNPGNEDKLEPKANTRIPILQK